VAGPAWRVRFLFDVARRLRCAMQVEISSLMVVNAGFVPPGRPKG
jgi:hypothetical protein